MINRRQIALGAAGLALPWPGLASAQTVAAPFVMTSQRILMPVLLNGKGPYPFVFDSGAAMNCIRGSTARDLGLKPNGTLQSGKFTYPSYQLQDIVVGGSVRLGNLNAMQLDDIGQEADGLLAANLLTGRDSVLDFDLRQWRAYLDGPKAPMEPGFVQLPAEILPKQIPNANFSRRIFVDLVLDGRRMPQCLIDTGTPRPIVVSNQQGEALGYLRPEVPYAPVRAGGGVDPTKYVARLVRAKEVAIGPLRFERVMVLVRPPGASGPDYVMGLPVIHAMNLRVRAREGEVWAKKSQAPPSDVDYSATGLFLDGASGLVTVVDVGAGSPAAGAGVRPGDTLPDIPPQEAGRVANAPPGTALTLAISSGGQSKSIDLVAAAYL
jgi:hypothetical protein